MNNNSIRSFLDLFMRLITLIDQEYDLIVSSLREPSLTWPSNHLSAQASKVINGDDTFDLLTISIILG